MATAAHKAKPERQLEAYVACDLLSWRPHPLPRGTEVTGLITGDLLNELIERGDVSRTPPEN